MVTPCEPQLGRYEGLYSTLSFMQESVTESLEITPREWLHLVAYADGNHDLAQLSEVTKVHWRKVMEGMEKLYRLGLVSRD